MPDPSASTDRDFLAECRKLVRDHGTHLNGTQARQVEAALDLAVAMCDDAVMGGAQ